MICYRYFLPVLIAVILSINISAGLAQTTPHLQLTMIGNGRGPYYAPAGQTTQLKIEILNVRTDDVYLIRGEVHLDLNLNGNWQLVHSESLDNFHLNYLRSAIWTFDLAVPPNIRAANATNGVPQVVLLIRTVYSTANGLKQTEEAQFALSVPGAIVAQANHSIWLIAAMAVAVLALCVLAYRHVSKRHLSRKPHVS